MKNPSLALSPPVIPPVEDGLPRPRWSVMIPTFNCADQVGEALASVLGQAPSPDEMEIVVVDDASSDHIAKVVASYGDRVRFRRQPTNLGVPTNLTEALRLARGTFVHLLHGDDHVLPGFYEAMDDAFHDPEVGAAYCRYAYVNDEGEFLEAGPLVQATKGRLPDAVRFLATEQRIMTPSICVRREAYERLGGFHPALRCAEDWEMWVRIANRYPIAYIPDVLAAYRIQSKSNTGRNVRSGRDVFFNGLAIEIIRSHLPEEIAEHTVARARKTYARSALGAARDLAHRGDMRAAFAQFRAALQLDSTLTTRALSARTLLAIGRAALIRRRPA